MDQLNDFGMGQVDIGAPGLAAHGRPAPLNICSGAAIKNNGVSRIQFALNIPIHCGGLQQTRA